VCAAFERALGALGGASLALFSTGADGHVARNEPGSSLQSRTRPKTLAADTLEQLAQRWRVPPAELPRVALTVGVGTLLDAQEVLVLFSGSKRARALEAALEKGINHMFPVSAFQRHKKVTCVENFTA
jgi:glucosamine-6-phosphate deaminase